MNSYLIYIIIASTTIASPGPGIVLTITNSLKYGVKYTIAGIAGITVGMLLISISVGGGLGLIILKSPSAFLTLKVLGSVYLLYLGIKLIIKSNKVVDINELEFVLEHKKLFIEGLLLTLSNPKPILFFIALFPQFIVSDKEYFQQFIILSLTFCFLIILIHLAYASFSSFLKKKTKGYNYFKLINIIGGGAYIFFAVTLLFLQK